MNIKSFNKQKQPHSWRRRIITGKLQRAEEKSSNFFCQLKKKQTLETIYFPNNIFLETNMYFQITG